MILFCGCDASVNRSVYVSDGEHSDGQTSVNGDILLAKSLIRGDIVIKGRHGKLFDHSHIDIRIRDGSRVEGGIIVRDPDVDVKVYLSKDSAVMGEIRNAQVIKE